MRFVGPAAVFLVALSLSGTSWAECARYEGGDAKPTGTFYIRGLVERTK